MKHLVAFIQKHQLACVALMWCCTAQAAPFCFDSAAGATQCIYQDAKTCTQDAHRQNTNCAVSRAELPMPSSGLAYCATDNARHPACLYPDYTSCRKAAAPYGVCSKRVADDVAQINSASAAYFANSLRPQQKPTQTYMPLQ